MLNVVHFYEKYDHLSENCLKKLSYHHPIRRILESQSQWKVTSEANSYKLHLRKSLCVSFSPHLL